MLITIDLRNKNRLYKEKINDKYRINKGYA